MDFKKANEKEELIINYLNEKFKTSSEIHRKLILNYTKKLKKLKFLAKTVNLKFIDLNKEKFGSEKDFIFADRVHLTDLGNKISARIILITLIKRKN